MNHAERKESLPLENANSRGTDLRVSELKQARTVFIQTLVLNLLVAIAKISWGFLSHTLSMVADGFHSLLDASANVVGICGLSISMKPPDDDHPYGHHKFETLSAMVISFFMFMACFQVLSQIIERVFSPSLPPNVTLVSYLIMIGTGIINYLVSRYEGRKGKELNNDLLSADASHTLSDLYVTCTVLATLLAIQMHFPILDLIGSLIVVGFIFKAGYDIIICHLGALVDGAVLSPELVKRLVQEVDGVSSCHRIRSRGMRNHIFVDLHVQIPKHLSIEEAHQISGLVEEKIKQSTVGVVDVLVHMEDDGPQLPGD